MVRPVYIKGLDDRFDKIAFFTAVLGGLAIITAIRFLGDGWGSFGNSKLSAFFAIIVSILVIAGYTTFIWISRARSPMSIDRASDNAYYIGLLFTLWSLGITLYKITITDEEQGNLVVSLLPDFGLALGSTIAGIFARIFLQQLRGDPNDVESEAREELNKSAIALRTSIGSIVADLNSLSSQISVSLSEVSRNVTEVMDSTAKANEETNKSIASNFDRINRKSEEQMELIYASSGKVIGQMDGLVQKMQTEFQGLGDAPKMLEVGIKDVALQLNNLSKTTQSIVTSQSDLLKQTEILANQFMIINSSVDGEKMMQLSESTIQSLQNLQSQADGLNSEFSKYNDVAEQLSNSEKEATDAVENYIGSLKGAAGYINDFINGKAKG